VTIGTPEAGYLLVHAHRLVAEPFPSLAGLWQRTTVFLARQALELAVRDALRLRAPGAERASARAQFLCLPSYVSTPVAHDAAYLWSVLSRACHQHPYELSPTAEELSRWLAAVDGVVRRLASPTATEPA
jgi:hypothetical protein